MSTIEGRTRRALLVIDVQQGVFADAHDRDGVIERIAGLVDRARRADAPVVWVQHSDDGLVAGSDDWQIVDALAPSPHEPIVAKHHGDAFEGTSLDERLAALGVAEIVVTGGESDACIRSTIHGGFARGYDVTLVGDAHSTADRREWDAALPSPAQVIAHTNTYWRHQTAPGKTASVVQSADLDLSSTR